ncbi:MAG: hypothetical protein R2838_16525 [Caldilineaceae bacterium]
MKSRSWAKAIEVDHYLTYSTPSYAESLSYFPEMDNYNVGPEAYLELMRQAKEATDIIGSLNGVSTGGAGSTMPSACRMPAPRPGSKHLLHSHRSVHVRRGRGAGIWMWSRT